MFYSQAFIYFRALVATVLAYIRAFVWKLSAGGAVPARPGDRSLSAVWLRQVLEANGYRGFSIKSMQIGDNANNRGLDGSINKIHLEYEPADASVSLPPTRFVLKTSVSGFTGRAKTMCQRSFRESWFYASALFRNLAPNYPRVFYSYGSSLMGEMVALAEDISVIPGATPANFVFGNQIWGIPVEVKPKRDEVATLECVFTQAARMHALYWKDDTLLKPQQSWLKHNGWYSNQGREEWEVALNKIWNYWKRGKSRALDTSSGLKFSPRLIAIVDKSFETSSWEKVQAQVQNKNIPFTLTHGDFHASNMFVVRDADTDKDRAIWFDWSEVGPWEPTADLAQMFISDVKPAVTKANAKRIVRAYYDELIKNGVSQNEYSWETCWNTFCQNGPEKWIWLLPLLLDLGLPTNAMQYFHDQVFSFIEAFCPNKDAFEIKSLAHLLG